MDCVRVNKESCRGCFLSYDPKRFDGGCRVQALTQKRRKELSSMNFLEYMIGRYGDSSGAEGDLAKEVQRLDSEGYPVKEIDSFMELVSLCSRVNERANTAIKESLWVEYSYITGKPLKWLADEVQPTA